MKIVAATQNKNKIREIEAITLPLGFEILSREDAGVPDFDILEDGDTFEANSLKKALEIYKVCGMPTLADDSGIEVDFLDGAPGVYSARFAGIDGDDADAKNNEKLLGLLEGLPYEKRTGKFVSVITLVFSEDDIIVARGECPGHILENISGENGFGYDPLFAPLGYDKTFGDISPEIKNDISHRAKALKALKARLLQR